jgi:hypothetical protein
MSHLPAVQVLLDGQPVALPGKALKKLSSVRAQLEQLAMRKDRILTALWVDGIAVNLQQSSVESPPCTGKLSRRPRAFIAPARKC